MALISWNTIGKCRGVLCHFLFHLVLTIWFISLGCKYKISTNTMNDFSVKPSWSSFTICLDFNSCYSCWWQCRIESFQIHLQVKKKKNCLCGNIYNFLVQHWFACYPWRSLLADIIQSQDIKELCSVLVVLSGEAAKTLAGIYINITKFYAFHLLVLVWHAHTIWRSMYAFHLIVCSVLLAAFSG